MTDWRDDVIPKVRGIFVQAHSKRNILKACIGRDSTKYLQSVQGTDPSIKYGYKQDTIPVY